MASTILRAPLQSVNPARLRELQEMYPKAELQIEVGQAAPKMSEAAFWKLINLLDWSKTGDDDAVLAPLVDKLAASPLRSIYEFQDHLSEKLFALDREDIARETGEDGWKKGRYFSVDGFLYARCCVVANGRAAFEKVVNGPASMPKDMDFEAILYAAAEAFERKTGKPFDYMPAFNYETYSNQAGWQ